MTSEFPGKPIVIVTMAGEDRTGVESALRDLGYDVRGVASIRGIRTVLADCPNAVAVFTDLVLQDGNWRDLLDQVKAYDVPLILCTRVGTAELWRDALECGVLEILGPPYSSRCFERILNWRRKRGVK